MKKETKRFPFEIKEFNEEKEYYSFKGYASTFGNVDFGDDVVMQGAFQKSLSTNKELPILWQHNMSEPIGKSVTLYEDTKGLFIEAILPKDDDLVKGRVMPQIRS